MAAVTRIFCGLLFFLVFAHQAESLYKYGNNVQTIDTSYYERYLECSWFIFCTWRTRYVYRESYQCYSGWYSNDNWECNYAYCNGLTNLNGACNNYFSNSHIIYDRTSVQYYSAGSCVSPGSCSCTKNGFYGNGHTCGMCTAMSNCDTEICSNYYNQYCGRCAGRVHDQQGYRAYRNTGGTCYQACSWRSDSTRCYPGSCPSEYSSSCSCTSGFSGSHCSTIDTYPTIHNNYLYIVQGGTMYSPHNVNAGPTQSTKWTNYNNPSNLNFRFQTSYSISAPGYHNYVSGFSVGLTGARFYLYQQRSGHNIRSYSYTCPSAGSTGSPLTSILTCTSDISPSSYLTLPMNHLDVLLFYCQSDNGGWVTIVNHETGGSSTHYYSGKTQSYSYTFTIDIVDPYHCYGNTNCLNQLLDVPDVAVSSPVTLTWSNWVDDNSGIDTFTLVTYKLVESGGSLVKDSHHSTVSKSSGSTSHSLSMSSSGMYQTVITCHDVATNYKKGRRLFLYDPTSTITTHTGVLRVQTAAVNTTWVWQHSLNPVTVDWTDRYWNSFHHNNKLLYQVASESEVETNYDDYESTRPRTAITNIWGIVKFTTAFSVDHQGGATLGTPSLGSFVQESDLDMTRTFNPSVVDGDTVRFWVRSYDLRDYSYSYTESVTVHIDTSPPEIGNLWLTSQDYLPLYVHDSLDLSTMTIEWDAYDYHSGINSIYWRLYDNFTLTDIDHGYAQESTQGSTSSLSQCNSAYASYARGASCYCTGPVGCYHKHYQVQPNVVPRSNGIGGVFDDGQYGVHDYDYWIEITVTNHANLITVLTEQITIDNSPPEGGHVMDSSSGSDDEDFRSDRNLNAHWEGFYDKESSVRFYQYGWDTSCLAANNFDRHNPSNKVTQTTNTYASYTAPSWNTKYYCTVVAYNEALAQSDPVCSDGIIADSNTPSIATIWVEGVSIPPGRFRVGNDVYLLESDRMRVAVSNPTSSCRSSSLSISSSYLNIFQARSHDGGNTDLTMDSSTACAYDALDSNFLTRFYFIYDGHLYLNWTSSDSVSHLTEQYVAIGTSSSYGTRNILDWQATNNQNHYQLYHPNINEGTNFYIHVQAVDAGGRFHVSTIGPGIVHKTSAPSYSQTPSFSMTSNYLRAAWSTSYFSDNERNYLKYKVAFEDVTNGELVYPYHEPVSGASCTVSSPTSATCTSIPVSDLLTDVHEGHQYRAILQVTNLANITYSKVSSTYTHRTETPESGVIYEVVPDGEQTLLGISNTENTDFQISTTSLKVRWFGFDTRWHTVSYWVALGTSPGSTNVVGWRSVGGGSLEYTFTSLSLATDYVYYCRLRAYTSVGSVYVNSDGVRIVLPGRTVTGVTINDGDGDCHHQYNDQPGGFSALHQHNALSVSCPTDVDYQPMMNIFSAHWTMSSSNKAKFPDIWWNMDVYNRTLSTWEQYRGWEAISRQETVYATGLSLTPGEKYRSGIRFCVGSACANTLNSDGVIITPNAPVAGTLTIDYTVSGATGTLTADFEKFYDPDIADLTQAQNAIAGYQYALPDNTHDSRLLDDWKNVVASSLNSTFNRITVTFNPAIDFSVCRRFAIRGYNYVGMSATVSREIQNCTAFNPLLIVPNKVIDAVGPQAGDLDYVGDSIVLEQNAEWPTPDADYTPYTNVISAVWPKLRHRNYTYAVIRLTGSWDDTHYVGSNHLSTTDPCNYANVLTCGETTHEYVNVYFSGGSLLTHGRRYAVCVHAEATQIVHEKWVEDLDEVGECSTGITVDTTAPTSGRVWLANLRNTMYSPYTNEATLQWDNFLDVEQQSYASHDSGISHYQVALGSVEYGEDVLKFYDVGLINQVKLQNLNLAEGSMFYASVKAFDFTGKSTVVTSSGFVVDNTPPIVTNAQFKFDYKYLTSMSSVSVCWDNMFTDPESSISSYSWAVGGRPGHTDRLDFTSTSTSTCGSSSMTSNLVDGKAYYVTVVAYNGAGLYNISVSRPIVVSVSGPTAGTVFDGASSSRTTTSQDDDYKSSVASPLQAYWRWFYNPYSPIVHYTVSLGSCSGCDDVVKDRYVGLRTEIQYDDVELSHGTRYYTTVTACDALDRCVSATSDGVLVDVTAPSPGVVQDGTFSEDIDFQSVRNFLGAKWYGFHDPESLLVSYHWSAGTSAGGTDILGWTALKFTEIAYNAAFSPNLPVGSKIYINVRATNNAGLSTVSSSNGFIVDTSAPSANFQPRLMSGIGTIDGSNLISRDALRVEWAFTDTQSSIDYYSVSIKSNQKNDYAASAITFPSAVTDHTFTHSDILSLQDDWTYNVVVTACNLAKLCTTSTSANILVDSTPPLPGMFAVETIHAARLTRHQNTWMTYTSNQVKLAWVGFWDSHSAVDHYLVSIGTEPFATDLNSGGTYQQVSHSNSGTTFENEGYVQLKTFNTAANLGSYSSVFIGVWAVNGVGLKSQALHHEFTVGGGTLELKRRCTNYNCQGHCVCAIQDQTCSAASGCSDISGGSPTRDTVTVQDIVDLSFSGSASYGPSLTYLAAEWSITTTQGLPVKRYEVAAGVSSSSSPTGIYNANTERVWYDVGQMTQWVIPLYDRELTVDTSYSVFIRAWYSSNQYAIFKSPGVTVAPNAMTTTSNTAASVKDLLQSGDTKDTDYITSTSTVHVRWDGLFQAGTAGLDSFKVFISREVGAHDIYVSNSLSSGTTSHTASSLSLLENTRYYTTVAAHNRAGVMTTRTSDGFFVDGTAPEAGLVLDGAELRDIDAQGDDTKMLAQWRHFSDTGGSGIRRYLWCIGTVQDANTCNVVAWTDMGLKTHGEAYASMSSGTTYYNKVKAEDWAGNVSPVAISDGITVDTSGPQLVSQVYLSTSELLQNPSFEADQYVFDNTTVCDTGDPTSWSLNSDGCVKLQRSDAPIAAHDLHYILMSGDLSQTVSVTSGALYRLEITVGYPQVLEDHHKPLDGYVTLGLDSHAFHLDPDRCEGRCEIETENSILWNTLTFFHTTVSSSLTVDIGTRFSTSDMRMALDAVSLKRAYYSQQHGGQPLAPNTQTRALFLPHWSSVNAVWHFEDSETVIVDYMWAVGTVPGGTQLQNFVSVGKLNHGVAANLALTHNATVHVTVVATNLAGLSTKLELNPVTVDMTGPEITDLNDGAGLDVDYQTSYTIEANWAIRDNESNADYCVWAIGSVPGGYDVKIFESLSAQASYSVSHLVDNNTYPAPYTFYTTVRCYNTIGLFTVAYTNGVMVVSPDRSDGVQSMQILRDSSTFRSATDQCLTTSDNIRLKWDLEQTDTLIKSYKFRVQDVTPDPEYLLTINCTDNSTLLNSTNLNNTLLWYLWNSTVDNTTSSLCNCTFENETITGNLTYGDNDTVAFCIATTWLTNTSAIDRNITERLSPESDFPPFAASLYDVSVITSHNVSIGVTPVDIFDAEMQGQETMLIVSPPGPQVIGNMAIPDSNLTSTNLTVDWTGVFSSYWTDLVYEVTVGSKIGASNIVQWQETRDTTMTLDLSNSEVREFNLSLVITAYDECGLYNTYSSGLFLVNLP